MTLSDMLRADTREIFADAWSTRDGQVVPDSSAVKLGNDAIKLNATVLYADIDGSTSMVDNYLPAFAAEVYKSYLACAAKIIKAHKGVITAYDGDRIMAVYIGDRKNSNAATTALKLNYTVKKIINPAITAQYPTGKFSLRQAVGIDTSDLFVARTGVRGDNDLVWVGRAANYAAKLTSLSADFPSRITKDVFDKLSPEAKKTDGKLMWTPATWNTMNDFPIYRSTWTWPP